MQTAHATSEFQLRIDYHAAVNASLFDPADFLTDVTLQAPDSIAQSGTRGLALLFVSSIAFDTAITYTGNIPGIVTPQTITYT